MQTMLTMVIKATARVLYSSKQNSVYTLGTGHIIPLTAHRKPNVQAENSTQRDSTQRASTDAGD